MNTAPGYRTARACPDDRIVRKVLRFSLLALVTASCAVYADFLPSRICKVRTRQNIDQGWKFFKGDDAAASAASYNDASWQTVNLPHSVQYNRPDSAGEQSSVPGATSWNGIAWYRKSFTVPSGSRKVFLEFDAAMQIAQVYVNGTPVGTHNACGFSGFSFDITGAANKTGTNVLAVRLDCNYRDSIPPGRAGTPSTLGNAGNGYPDFYIFSGLYRDIWLVCSDSVYIPFNGQKISTPLATSTAARVRIRTSVRNDNSAAKSVTVSSCIVDSSGTIIAKYDLTNQVAANSSVVFDRLSDTLANPKLWSPESPYLYRVFTKVSVNGLVVDDYVDRFGIRSLSWTKAGGFYLNGQRYLLKGVCAHQEYAWVENAVPRSRFFQEVKLVKEMGANSIRCSHYPRSPAFYNACDELGMLCEVELPSWGCCSTAPYPASFWTRMNTTAQEMIDVGYNHPSIIAWGMFNEANTNSISTFTTPFTTLNATIHGLDSTRKTALYGNSPEVTPFQADLYGMNYEIRPSSTQSQVTGAFVSEYYEGWIKWCRRGDTSTRNDAALSGYLSENKCASDHWSGSNNWNAILSAWNATTSPVPAGGHMWSFIDYCSPFMDHPMGVLDEYRIPKKSFYMYRYNWTAAPYDTFIVGITPTHIQLDADLTTINADSTDITRIIGSLRDASGRCAFVARPITLQLSGPVDCFDSLTRTTIAGKIGWVLKSRNTPGTITVIATLSGLPADTITISSATPDNSPLPFIWPSTGIAASAHPAGAGPIRIRQGNGVLSILFANPPSAKTPVALVSLQGRRVVAADATNRARVTIDTRKVPAGIYTLCIGKATRKILIAR